MRLHLYWLLNGLALLVVTALSAAEPDPAATAKGALSLAKAKREREQAKGAPPAFSCHTDYILASAEAKRTGKHLVTWIGMKCTDVPELRKGLDEAVHCHVTAMDGNGTPRVEYRAADGTSYYVLKGNIDANTATKIKESWKPASVPQARLAKPEPISSVPAPIIIYSTPAYYYPAAPYCPPGGT